MDVKCGAAGVGLSGPHPVTHHARSAQPKHVMFAYAVQMYFDVILCNCNGSLKASLMAIDSVTHYDQGTCNAMLVIYWLHI